MFVKNKMWWEPTPKCEGNVRADELLLSISTGDRGATMGKSGRDFLNSFSSISMLSLELSMIVLMVTRRVWRDGVSDGSLDLQVRGAEQVVQ
jgi:hypothetical protein